MRLPALQLSAPTKVQKKSQWFIPNEHAVLIIPSSAAECFSFCHHGPHFLTIALSILTGNWIFWHVFLCLWDFTSQVLVSQVVPTVALWCQKGMFWGLEALWCQKGMFWGLQSLWCQKGMFWEFWQEYGFSINTRFITSAGEKCKGKY